MVTTFFKMQSLLTCYIIINIMEMNDSWKRGYTIKTWIKREIVHVKSEFRWGGGGGGGGGGVDETLRRTQPKKFLNSIMGRCHIFLIL